MGTNHRNKPGIEKNRRSCCQNIMVKKDWKTSILLLPDNATDVSTLRVYFTTTFLHQNSFLVLSYPFLVSVHFTHPSLLVVNFHRKNFDN